MEFINNDQYEDDKKEMDQDEKVVSMDVKKNNARNVACHGWFFCNYQSFFIL